MTGDVSRASDCFIRNIEQQIAAKQRGDRKLVRHGGTLCSGCYAEPPLPGQRYGAECHRIAVRASARRKQEELARLRKLARQAKIARD